MSSQEPTGLASGKDVFHQLKEVEGRGDCSYAKGLPITLGNCFESQRKPPALHQLCPHSTSDLWPLQGCGCHLMGPTSVTWNCVSMAALHVLLLWPYLWAEMSFTSSQKDNYFLLIRSSLHLENMMTLHTLLQPWSPCHVQPAWLSPGPPDGLAVRLGTAEPLPFLRGCAFLHLHTCWVLSLRTCLFSNSLHREQCLEALFFLSRHFLTSLGWVVTEVSQTEHAPLVTAQLPWVEGRMPASEQCLPFPGEPHHLLPCDIGTALCTFLVMLL